METNKREIIKFISDLVSKEQFNNPYKEEEKVKDFLSQNSWFGIEPDILDGKVYIPEKNVADLADRIVIFLKMQKMTDRQKYSELQKRLKENYPVLAEAISLFELDTKIDKKIIYSAIEFLYENMPKDLDLVDDSDIKELIYKVGEEEYKYIGDCIAFIFAYAREKTVVGYNKKGIRKQIPKFKLKYSKDYLMNKRIDTSEQKKAYSESEYLELLYYLINEEYAEDNDMYIKAAKSKNYADTWLFLSLHFITAMRDPNIQLLYHPTLSMNPEEVLLNITDGTFSDVDAKKISDKLMDWMYYLPHKSTKTKKKHNIPRVPFFIPISCEIHFGKLFAICEAHHQIHGLGENIPLIRKIKSYEQINRYMGDEIGSLFLERDFNTRRANKSYMQSIELYADPILSNEGIEESKNYVLISMARSHKGGYNSFASTTAEYLKDANFSGLSVEFVSRELFERGFLSSIVSMLLQIITGGEYNSYSPQLQTALIKHLELDASQAEALVKISEKAKTNAVKVVNEVLASTNNSNKNEMILQALHRLACGNAPAREENVYCLPKAITGKCIYEDRHPCQIGCEYEIGTKASAYHLMSEYNRIFSLYEKTDNTLEKEKYKWILTNGILPLLNDMLSCMKNIYGERYYNDFVEIIKSLS